MQIPAVASALLAMHNDGVPMLTRRELVTDNRLLRHGPGKSVLGLLRYRRRPTWQLRVNSGHGRIEVARLAGSRLGTPGRVARTIAAGGAVCGPDVGSRRWREALVQIDGMYPVRASTRATSAVGSAVAVLGPSAESRGDSHRAGGEGRRRR